MKVSLSELIACGRRRLLRNDLAVVCARAATAGMLAFVLLLLVGTDILNWRWLAVFSILTFAAGAFVVLRRRPAAYRMAQLLDARLRLADTLSTAIYYSTLLPPRKCDEETRLSQREQAARMAGTVDVRSALPLRIPRRIQFSFVALTVLAASLALLRYRAEGLLELRQTMMGAIAQWVQQAKPEFAKLERYLRQTAQERGGTGPQDSYNSASEKSDPGSPATAPPENASVLPKKDPAESGDKQNGGSQGQGEKQSVGLQQSPSPRDASAKLDGSGAGQQQNQAFLHNGAEAGSSSSLLSRLSDSLANLTSALRSKPQSATGAGKHLVPGNSREKAKDAKTGMTSRSDSSDSTSGAGDPSRDSSPQNGGVDGMRAAVAKTDQRGGDAAGHDDGRKEIEATKRLEAMGKLSVILGKRSQNLTGTATIEATSGRPELKSAYEPRDASHATVAASAECDRVPLEFEAYVQEYFRELRKAQRPGVKKNKP